MILKNILVLGIVAFMLMGCQQSLYQYTVVCSGQKEPQVFSDTLDQVVRVSVYSTGYISLTVTQRRGILLEEHQWTDLQACSLHKKFLENVEPVGNDG